jgi:uridine phosphorylase
VNGAYNVKYEIVKKRIDKAVIKSTKERLTQPGKIAIVYSQSKDAYEYREYIDYLQHHGYLKEEIEDVELADMQAVQGLRALRVTVNLSKGAQSEEFVPESVEQAIREMSKNA